MQQHATCMGMNSDGAQKGIPFLFPSTFCSRHHPSPTTPCNPHANHVPPPVHHTPAVREGDKRRVRACSSTTNMSPPWMPTHASMGREGGMRTIGGGGWWRWEGRKQGTMTMTVTGGERMGDHNSHHNGHHNDHNDNDDDNHHHHHGRGTMTTTTTTTTGWRPGQWQQEGAHDDDDDGRGPMITMTMGGGTQWQWGGDHNVRGTMTSTAPPLLQEREGVSNFMFYVVYILSNFEQILLTVHLDSEWNLLGSFLLLFWVWAESTWILLRFQSDSADSTQTCGGV